MRIIGAILAALMLVVAQAPTLGEESMATDDGKAVRAAVDKWFVVLNAMLNGDPRPFADLYSHADDAYYMGAEGTYRVGWGAIYDDWKGQAEKSSGGEVVGSDIHVFVSGDMAMAAHYTRGQVRQPDGTMSENNVRETSVLRREADGWRIIGHHADGIPYWEKAFDQ